MMELRSRRLQERLGGNGTAAAEVAQLEEAALAQVGAWGLAAC